MKLCKLRVILIQEIQGKWYILGKGHHYNPDGYVYLWEDGGWCSLGNEGWPDRKGAEDNLAKWGYKEGIQYDGRP